MVKAMYGKITTQQQGVQNKEATRAKWLAHPVQSNNRLLGPLIKKYLSFLFPLPGEKLE